MAKITENQWKELCDRYGKSCYYSEVSNMTYEEASEHIQNLKSREPMD